MIQPAMTAASLFGVRGGGETWARGPDTLPRVPRRAQTQENTIFTIKYNSISCFLLTNSVERRHIARPEANSVLMNFERE